MKYYSPCIGILRNGLSLGSIPGVLFSNGPTWIEMRRTSLHVLRDFGLGKSILEDIVEEEVDNLIEYIDNHCQNEPIDVLSFFHISVLASLWRILSGEHLKRGNAKLHQLVDMVQTMIREAGHPLAFVSMNYVWLYKLVNNLGLIKAIEYMAVFLDHLKTSVIDDHKQRPIDGDNPLTFTEALLYKIQETSNSQNPLYDKTGELNLLNALFDLFLAGSDTTAITLDWAMLFMILNPDIQNKVRDELDQNFGIRKAKMTEKYKTPYTEAVIHEIQRKANILPLSVFHGTKTDLDIGKYSLPPGTVLIPFIGDVMNDPKHFPDPSKFLPER